MPEFNYGVKRALAEVITGFAVAVIVDAFSKGSLIPQGSFLIFNIINGMATVAIFEAMPVWSTSYLIGWIVGMLIMINSGLIGLLELGAYVFGAVLVIIYRYKDGI